MFSAAPRATLTLSRPLQTSPRDHESIPRCTHTRHEPQFCIGKSFFFLSLETVPPFGNRQNLFFDIFSSQFLRTNQIYFLILPHRKYFAFPKSSMIVFANYRSLQIIFYSKQNVIGHITGLCYGKIIQAKKGKKLVT